MIHDSYYVVFYKQNPTEELSVKFRVFYEISWIVWDLRFKLHKTI